MKGFVSNSIFYHNGRDGLAEYKLPTLLLDALELFELPVGHPAHPGHGVRTRVAITAGTDVAYYAGIYRPGVVAPDNPYVFGVHPLEKDMVIDAAVRGNITRFINDPRGTGLEPNLVADDMVIVGQRMELRTVVFRAICDIQPVRNSRLPTRPASRGTGALLRLRPLRRKKKCFKKRPPQLLPTALLLVVVVVVEKRLLLKWIASIASAIGAVCSCLKVTFQKTIVLVIAVRRSAGKPLKSARPTK